RGFSWKRGLSDFALKSSSRCSAYVTPDLPRVTAYLLSPGQPTPGTPSLLRHPIAIKSGAGILTSFPSVTRFRLTLGADSPCADERCARKPWAFGVGAFPPPFLFSSPPSCCLCLLSHFPS